MIRVVPDTFLPHIPSLSEVMPDAKVRLLSSDGDDRRIAQRARLSFDRDDDRGYEGLVEYLWEHAHAGPFEFNSLQVEITAPLAVVQQVLRHRTASFNQVSARYVELPDNDHIPPSGTWRVRPDASIKQGSQMAPEGFDEAGAERAYTQALQAAQGAYETLLAMGVAPEQARMVLPAARYTRLAMACDLRNWFGYLALRLDSHAQVEHRALAREIAWHISQEFPLCWEVFVVYTLEGARFSRREMAILREMLGKGGVDLLTECPGPIPSLVDRLGSKRRVNDFLKKLVDPTDESR